MTVKPLILVADDESSVRLQIRKVLQQNGLDVIEAEDGQQAVALFSVRQPDLVLLDWALPCMGGIETCRRIRALSGGTDLPIIILAAEEQHDAIRVTYEAGATDFCPRTIPWVILCERVRYMLGASSAARNLRESRELLNRAQQIARVGSFVYNPPEGFLEVSDVFCQLCGFNKAQQPRWDDFWNKIDPRDQALLKPAFQQLLDYGESLQLDISLLGEGPQRRFMKLQIDRDFNGASANSRYIGILQDITERKLSEIQEADQNCILRRIVHNEPLERILKAVMEMLERRHPDGAGLICLLENSRIETVYGSHVPQKLLSTLKHYVLTAEEKDFFAAFDSHTVGHLGAFEQNVFWLNRRLLLEAEGMHDAVSRPIISEARQLFGFVALLSGPSSLHDASRLDSVQKAAHLAAMAVAQRRLSQNLIYQAQHDSLTGLLNRGALAEILSQKLKQSARLPSIGAYLLIDLDRFKQVNDSLGHHIGDQLLVKVADRFRESVREGDVLSRVGGDEFVVVQPGLREKEDAARGAMRILEKLHEPFFVEGHCLLVEASIGITLFPNDAHDSITLHKNADIAMYASKNQGGKRFSFFDKYMQAAVAERLRMENDLRRAIKNNEFELYYQPLVNLATGAIAGMEALIRWNHPTRGCVLPGFFIAVAEESRLISSIDQWALREACRQNKAWQDQGLPPLRVLVNVSAVKFGEKHFVDMIEQALAETGLSPHCLGIEITETALMQNLNAARAALLYIRRNGVTATIDDFGTGYSSLTCLRHIPLDCIKIDRSFIHDLENTDSKHGGCNQMMVRALINLAHDLKISLLAEGIEKEAQSRLLIDMGCKSGQGFLFGRPLPAPESYRMLLDHFKKTGILS